MIARRTFSALDTTRQPTAARAHLSTSVKFRFLLVVGAAIAATVVAVPPAGALTIPNPVVPIEQIVLPTCGTNAQPFAPWGDNNSYFPFANNGFESGTSGWALSGAAFVGDGNEPFFVNGPGSHSLQLGPRASAASPLVCTNILDPAWRMFIHSVGANGSLHAQIIFYGLTGNLTGALNVSDAAPGGYAAWAPGPRVDSLLALPLATRYARLVLTSDASNGVWQVDDVYADPLGSRG